MCGIADVVFPDWLFFLLYIFTKRRRENVGSVYVKKRKERRKKNNLLKSGKISRFERSLQPKPFCVDTVVTIKEKNKKCNPVEFNGRSLNYGRFTALLRFLMLYLSHHLYGAVIGDSLWFPLYSREFITQPSQFVTL